MDGKFRVVEAVACLDSKIIALGKSDDMKNFKKKDFKIYDLRGKTVLPGFIDCHTHFLYFASTLDTLNLSGVKTFATLKSRIKEKLKNLKPGELLFVKGWDKNLFKDQSIFNKKTLDKISVQNPIAIFSKDQHTFWVNSIVLEMAEVDKKRKYFAPEKIEEDQKTKKPKGILREDATELILRLIKKVHQKKPKDLFEKAISIVHRNGIVGIHDLGGENTLANYQTFLSSGKLKLRVYVTIPQKNLDKALDLGMKTGFGNEFLKVGGVKLFADGALGSQTALTFEPYSGSENNYGIEVTSEKDLKILVKKANGSGIGVAIHAIGDRAVSQSLNALEKCGKKSLRNRIEHIQLVHPKDLKRFAQLKVIASVQPIHLTSDRDIAEKYWGKRCKFAYPYKTLLKNGATLVFGSDMPIEGFSPLKGIYSAVTRKKERERKDSWYPEQRISVKEAVYAYTLGAAYASGEERIKGSIELGKLADFVILSEDIFENSAEASRDFERILKTKVLATIFDGRIVFGFM